MRYWLRACALTLVPGLSYVLPAAAHTQRSPIRQVATQPSSLQFDGSNDIVRTTNLPLLTQFTIEAWVRRTSDSGGYQTFLSDANSSYHQVMFGLYVDGGSLDCGAGDQFAYYQSNGNSTQCSGVSADLGTGQSTADASPNRYTLTLGTQAGADAADPLWLASTAPIST